MGSAACQMQFAGVLCAAWWAAYARLQPGSASGTQAVESLHGNVWRPALVDDKGKPLRRSDPEVYFKAFGKAAKAYGRQNDVAGVMPDRPTSKDPEVRNGALLRAAGRSASVELFARKDLVHACNIPGAACVYVMPETLLQWRESRPARGSAQASGEYVAAAGEDLRLPFPILFNHCSCQQPAVSPGFPLEVF